MVPSIYDGDLSLLSVLSIDINRAHLCVPVYAVTHNRKDILMSIPAVLFPVTERRPGRPPPQVLGAILNSAQHRIGQDVILEPRPFVSVGDLVIMARGKVARLMSSPTPWSSCPTHLWPTPQAAYSALNLDQVVISIGGSNQ